MYGYNVVKGKVQRNLNRQGGMQILDNFPNGYTYISRMVKKLNKSLKAIVYSKECYIVL